MMKTRFYKQHGLQIRVYNDLGRNTFSMTLSQFDIILHEAIKKNDNILIMPDNSIKITRVY